jgi:FkbM family methyltransferase
MSSHIKCNPPLGKWIGSINSEIEFYQKTNPKKRVDSEFDWNWFDKNRNWSLRSATISMLKALQLDTAVKKAILKMENREIAPTYHEWLNKNTAPIWESRSMLDDDLSKVLFDRMLVLRSTSERQFYFPRFNFDDLVSILESTDFISHELPTDYIGLPLQIFKLNLNDKSSAALTILSTRLQIDLLNSYLQYLVYRNPINFAPIEGEVVLDCGSCIGEVSTIFAGLVGVHGQVHLFDPIPLHTKYSQLQGSLNKSLENVLHINTLAVGEVSSKSTGEMADATKISPGGLVIDSFDTTSLDDYVAFNNLNRVDFIKMDIEGSEMAALRGANQVIRDHKPRLAISAYHKPEDLWEIPHKLKEQNGDYKLYFGHHSPILWESVYYAWHPRSG